MLPLESAANVFESAVEETKARLGKRSSVREHWPRSIQSTRLWRNMLSSQPAAFNLFGQFTDYRALGNPAAQELIPWIRTIDRAASEVEAVHLEWAPRPREHLDSGSAFDAFVVYAAGSKRRFLAIECKYAEKLTESFSAREQMRKTRDGTKVMKIWGDGYRDYTKECRLWVDDAWEPMDKRGLQQFWLNTLLAQSLLKRGKGDQSFEGGTSVVMAHAKDTDAKDAAAAVAKQLRPGNVQLVWSPYECLIEKLAQRTWVDDFRARYLDFTPVEQLLPQGDPRQKDTK